MKIYTRSIPHLWRSATYLLCRYKATDTSKWLEPTGHATDISIYNSITKSKVPLVLRNPHYANWYMCGPTVYDSAHLGHACCYVRFDIIRRILQNFFNINVVIVMGITDVDDKIIARAEEMKQDIKSLAYHYEKEFFSDMANLNVLPPTVSVRVTDVIPSIVRFIQQVIDKGYAYCTDDGSVYFDTSNYGHYGKLFPVVTDESVSPNPEKKCALDFALWKGAKEGEPWWPSPWQKGKGRPGWHIECSTIASNMLGSNIDLHSGGVDLLFPHHENEEAQSCAHHDVKQWVNYWLHSGHLHLKGDDKMSKSLKNTISIEKFLEAHTANHFRMFCLLSRYRNGVEYSVTTLDNAKGMCKKIEEFLESCSAYIKGVTSQGVVSESELLENMATAKVKFLSALADDFDTPKAMNAITDLVTVGNKMLHADAQQEIEFSRSPAAVAAVSSFIQETMNKLGAQISSHEILIQKKSELDVEKIIDKVLQFRNTVRETTMTSLLRKSNKQVGQNEEYVREAGQDLMKACDQLRNDLHATGVQIKDHGKASSWSIRK